MELPFHFLATHRDPLGPSKSQNTRKQALKEHCIGLLVRIHYILSYVNGEAKAGVYFEIWI
jgi:hypothetical protein